MLQSDVHHTQRVMEGLNRQSRTLNQAMANVKLRGDANDSSQSSSYFETDIDTMTTRDLALKQVMLRGCCCCLYSSCII